MATDRRTPCPADGSSDYEAMLPYWEMVNAIVGGAGSMRSAKERYLPKLPNESIADYDHRLKSTPFTNLYSDILGNLASKPFSKEVAFKEGTASEAILRLAEDIDGQGNNLHVFAGGVFADGLNKSIDWIFVDYTKAVPREDGRPLSVQEERDQGLRPYWVHIPAERMFAVYSDHVNGKEIFVHARIYEPLVERDGFGEKVLERVRVLDRQPVIGAGGKVVGYAPATFEVYEKQKNAEGKETWASIEGPTRIAINVISLVPFVTGRRLGASWQVRPPLRDLAHLQIEEFQQESNLKAVMELTCFPMLAGNGIAQPVDAKGENVRVPVGPRAVLFAPPDSEGNHGTWTFLEPGAESIKTLIAHLDETRKEMRDLGMQPLTMANLTVITTAHVSSKAHSAVQRWALALKDALEQAFRYTVMWLKDGSKDPEVQVHTDFGVDLEAGAELDALIKIRATGDLSRQNLLGEFRRRGVLGDDFDPAQNDEELSEEGPALGTIPPPGQTPPPANDGSRVAA